LGEKTVSGYGEVGRQISFIREIKRNNKIDILKAGGTRIMLFLHIKDIFLTVKCQVLSLMLRVVEGAGLPLSTAKTR